MQRTAEWGAVAHWTYKERGGKDDRKRDQRFAWLRQLMDWQKEVLDAEMFVDAVKVDVFRDEVFVFTPKGDVLALPTGATAVDFAYRIHTEVGHRCIGAKANGRMVPLDYQLQNGDMSAHSVLLTYMGAGQQPDGNGEFPLIPLVPQFKPTGEIRVKGERGVLTQIAQCCKPVPGDPISGYITRGKGITVHRTSCKNIMNVSSQGRGVPVDWDTGGRQLYPVGIKIEAWDRTGLLRDIATVIAESKINLTGAEVQVYDDKTAVISTTVEISSLTQLSRLMERLETGQDAHPLARASNLARN